MQRLPLSPASSQDVVIDINQVHDLLDFSDEVLQHIIAALPLKDAIKTLSGTNKRLQGLCAEDMNQRSSSNNVDDIRSLLRFFKHQITNCNDQIGDIHNKMTKYRTIGATGILGFGGSITTSLFIYEMREKNPETMSKMLLALTLIISLALLFYAVIKAVTNYRLNTQSERLMEKIEKTNKLITSEHERIESLRTPRPA